MKYPENRFKKPILKIVPKEEFRFYQFYHKVYSIVFSLFKFFIIYLNCPNHVFIKISSFYMVYNNYGHMNETR